MPLFRTTEIHYFIFLFEFPKNIIAHDSSKEHYHEEFDMNLTTF